VQVSPHLTWEEAMSWIKGTYSTFPTRDSYDAGAPRNDNSGCIMSLRVKRGNLAFFGRIVLKKLRYLSLSV